VFTPIGYNSQATSLTTPKLMRINLATSLLLPPRRSLARCVCLIAGVELITIMVRSAQEWLFAPTKYLDRAMETLSAVPEPLEFTRLADLSRTRLTLARSREFPERSSRHGYDFIAPLDTDGHIDPALWRKYRDYCRVRRFSQGEEDEVGRLVHKPGGTERARWVFDYNADEDDGNEAGYRFGAHKFSPGEYVSISGQDRKLHTFRVVAVDPVVLSMALINSFALDLKI
jgi:hypothetical protein